MITEGCSDAALFFLCLIHDFSIADSFYPLPMADVSAIIRIWKIGYGSQSVVLISAAS